MAEEKAFLVPVVVDDISERSASVSDKFHEVQWTHLPAGESPTAFVERVSRLLSDPQTAQSTAMPPLAPDPYIAPPSQQPKSKPAVSRRSQPALWRIAAIAQMTRDWADRMAFMIAGIHADRGEVDQAFV